MGKVYGTKVDQSVRALIVNLITGSYIEIKCLPDTLGEQVGASFDPHSIRGRSNQIQGYNETSSRNLSVPLMVSDDLEPDGILNLVNRIKALVYPEYSGFRIIPPECYIKVGKMISLKGKCDSVDINWQKPYRNGVYTIAEISLSMVECWELPYSASDIESGVTNG